MPQYRSFVWVEFHGTQAGKTCFNQLLFGRETVVSAPSMAAATTAIETVMWGAVKPLLSNSYRLNSIKAWCNQAPLGANVPAFTRLVDEVGDVTDSEAMPPWNVVNILKIPDNAEKFPAEAQDFEQGRMGWSGIPESQQDNGFLTDDALADWQTAAEAFEELTFNVGGTPTTWQLVIFRGVVGGDDVTVPVIETEVQQQTGRRGSRWK